MKISELQREIDRLLQREKDLLKQLSEMDAFKLDEIARELKKIEVNITRGKKSAQDLVNHSKTLSNPGDQKQICICYTSKLTPPNVP